VSVTRVPQEERSRATQLRLLDAERARFVFDEIMRVALGLGGAITGEHGVGILKAPHLADQLGDAVMDLNRRVKAALDPAGILNRGTWI